MQLYNFLITSTNGFTQRFLNKYDKTSQLKFGLLNIKQSRLNMIQLQEINNNSNNNHNKEQAQILSQFNQPKTPTLEGVFITNKAQNNIKNSDINWVLLKKNGKIIMSTLFLFFILVIIVFCAFNYIDESSKKLRVT